MLLITYEFEKQISLCILQGKKTHSSYRNLYCSKLINDTKGEDGREGEDGVEGGGYSQL